MRRIHCRGRRHSPFRHGHRARWRMMCRITVPVVIAILISILHLLGPIKSCWRQFVSMRSTVSRKASRWWRWRRWERHGQQHLVGNILCSNGHKAKPIAKYILPRLSSASVRRHLARNVALAPVRHYFRAATSIQSRSVYRIKSSILNMDRHDQQV
jgi:hypothetical protein